MARSTTTYTFGRLNIIPSLAAEEKQAFIRAGLQGPPVTHRESYWSFLEVTNLDVDDEQFITGFLVRYRAEAEEEVVNQATRSIDTEMLQNALDAKSRFFLHPASMVIAFHAVPPKINIGAFTERFASLFTAAHNNFFVKAEIQIIEEEFAVLEAMRRFERISVVRLYLHPSNPHNRDLWKAVDEHLKRMNVAEYKEEFKAAKESSGLHVTEDQEVRQKVAMAEDGYGKATVRGVLNGRTVTISTSDNPVQANVARTESAPGGIVSVLKATFQSLWDRVRQ